MLHVSEMMSNFAHFPDEVDMVLERLVADVRELVELGELLWQERTEAVLHGLEMLLTVKLSRNVFADAELLVAGKPLDCKDWTSEFWSSLLPGRSENSDSRPQAYYNFEL